MPVSHSSFVHVPFARRRSRALATIVLLSAGCTAESALSANGIPSRTLQVSLGQDIAITLQTIGPGDYSSPPAISGTSIAFLDVVQVTPSVPAGPTQRFRFRALALGQAVIQFQQSFSGLVVKDTIVVR